MNAQRLSDVLTSSWVLAVPNTKLPSGHDILDRALQKTIARNNFPKDFEKLRFVTTPAGIRCPELREALSLAQASDQTAEPNPTYSTTALNGSEFVAKVILNELGICPDEAKRWGEALLAAVREEQAAKKR